MPPPVLVPQTGLVVEGSTFNTWLAVPGAKTVQALVDPL